MQPESSSPPGRRPRCKTISNSSFGYGNSLLAAALENLLSWRADWLREPSAPR
jgi:hypothetical protein